MGWLVDEGASILPPGRHPAARELNIVSRQWKTAVAKESMVFQL